MLQQIINTLYRHPKSALKKVKRFGGYTGYYSMQKSGKQMMRASLNLPAVSSLDGDLPVYFLTGKNHLYQTLFCIQSLSKVTAAKFKYTLVDDGTFDDEVIIQINRQLPGARIVTQNEINNNLNKCLPYNLYPNLNQKRKVYPHLKKITDIHSISNTNAWKLVLDSDMLFWNDPQEMIDWIIKPQLPIHMVDCTEAYGYSKKLMEELAGTNIKPLINVGIIGLNSNDINWKNIETWIKKLEEQEGTSYYLEQALTAMLIGDKASMVLQAEQYIVNPDNDDVKNKGGILHHYVDLSKKDYFNMAWKQFIDLD